MFQLTNQLLFSHRKSIKKSFDFPYDKIRHLHDWKFRLRVWRTSVVYLPCILEDCILKTSIAIDELAAFCADREKTSKYLFSMLIFKLNITGIIYKVVDIIVIAKTESGFSNIRNDFIRACYWDFWEDQNQNRLQTARFSTNLPLIFYILYCVNSLWTVAFEAYEVAVGM